MRRVITHVVLVLIYLCAYPNTAKAQGRDDNILKDSTYMEIHRRGRITFTCLSYYQGESGMSGIYSAENKRHIAWMDNFFGALLKDRRIVFDQATVLGTTSIEGMYETNVQLARQRAEALYRLLNRRYHLIDLMPVQIASQAEDWQGLAECVLKTDPVSFPWRDRVLDIIRTVPITKGREAQLMLLGEGEPYRYMLKHFFPEQRRSYITIEYDLKHELERRLGRTLDDDDVDMVVAKTFFGSKQAEAFVKGESLRALTLNAQGNLTLDRIIDKICAIRRDFGWQIPRLPDNTYVSAPSVLPALPMLPFTPAKRSFRPLLVVKTNLVAAAGVSTEIKYRTPMPNLELEWLINERFSVAVAGLFEKFSITPGYDAWHTTAYTLEGRYRVWPRATYGGLYLGLYGRMGDYNIRRSAANAPTGNTGRYSATGLSVGYTLPLSNHWILEAGAACGYRHNRIKSYTHEAPQENYIDDQRGKDKFELGDLFVRIGYRIGKWRANR